MPKMKMWTLKNPFDAPFQWALEEYPKEIAVLCDELKELINRQPEVLGTLRIKGGRTITCREVLPKRGRGRQGDSRPHQRRYIDTDGQLWWSPDIPLSLMCQLTPEISPKVMFIHDLVWWHKDLKKLAKQLRQL